MRCVHEASLWPVNSFVTLTYDDEHLPFTESEGHSVPTLRPDDFTLFMKRFRAGRPGKVRYLQAGEYGDRLGRPHHHAILFNVGFADKKLLRDSPTGSPLYTSVELAKAWGHGYTSVAEVTFESSAYVARYTLKKAGGQAGMSAASGPAAVPGMRVSEYLTMSRRPGIGAGWLKKFQSDVYPGDRVVARMKADRPPVLSKPPRFYDEWYRKLDPEAYAALKARRALAASDPRRKEEDSEARGAVKEECARRRVNEFLTRRLSK